MRTIRLLATFLLGLTSIGAAATSERTQAVADSTPVLSKADRSTGIPYERRDDLTYRLFSPIDGQMVCYKMRTYFVAREERHSDSTKPVGYSTCQPSWRFDVKSADEPANATPTEGDLPKQDSR